METPSKNLGGRDPTTFHDWRLWLFLRQPTTGLKIWTHYCNMKHLNSIPQAPSKALITAMNKWQIKATFSSTISNICTRSDKLDIQSYSLTATSALCICHQHRGFPSDLHCIWVKTQIQSCNSIAENGRSWKQNSEYGAKTGIKVKL